ncbi:MAG: leucyl/phenylalanyl-tRNA--protein transferase [Verrucomicrobiales bacterium]|nr:leucyl/phenylalanyl-tRNA--protein transferase [Verrucomicrobiales bacterium]
MSEGLMDSEGSGVLIDPAFLLRAYGAGIFPMAMEDGEIGWFSPDPRGVIPLDERFHVPHGLKRRMRKVAFDLRINVGFEAVMEGCADREETWIDGTVMRTYAALHRLGYAHSVEVWMEGELVGGLYGVAVGSAFFGESMFSRVSGASQVALVGLVERLRERKYRLLDTQWTTEHLKRFGAMDLPKREYLRELSIATGEDNRFA